MFINVNLLAQPGVTGITGIARASPPRFGWGAALGERHAWGDVCVEQVFWMITLL